jgi:2-polyprenyl-3-methyl-5-hydroxy-6-metoxy-1,4-benzoquinol methylase
MPIKVNYCPFCGSAQFKSLYKIKPENYMSSIFELDTERFQRLFSYNLRKCKSCGLLYSGRVLTQSETNKFYNFSSRDPFRKREKTRERLNDFNSFLNLLGQYLSLSQKKILEVGCAQGLLLALAKKRGAIPTGFEIDKECVMFAQEKLGLKVIESDFLAYKFAKNDLFDIVVFFATFEHLRNPLDYLKKAHSMLKPNGVLYLSTPETCFITKNILRHKCYNYILGHYIYPPKKLMLDKLNEIGFDIIFCESTKLTVQLIVYLLFELFRKILKTKKIPTQKSFAYFIDPHEKFFKKLSKLALLPFSLGVIRILCKKRAD